MNVKLLTEHHLEFLSLTGGCTGRSLHLSKCHIFGNHMSWLIYVLIEKQENEMFDSTPLSRDLIGHFVHYNFVGVSVSMP